MTDLPNTTNCPKCNGTGLIKHKNCDFCGGEGIIEEISPELRYLLMCADLGILTSSQYQRLQELDSGAS